MKKPTRSKAQTTPEPPDTDPAPPYDPYAIFDEDGPINPSFMREAVRTLMRTMPLDPVEPPAWAHRRMHSAMLALAALHPRDEIEVLLAIQALAACQAAAACWRIGMNHHRPNGDSTRHLTSAANAARTFDALLKALERRQAKPLAVPPGRPPSRVWPDQDPTRFMLVWEDRCRQGHDAVPPEEPSLPELPDIWTPHALAVAAQLRDQARIEAENEGLDLANTQDILPGGGMIVPPDPTPQQQAYMARRLGLSYQQERDDNMRRGSQALPKIRPLRPGDLIP